MRLNCFILIVTTCLALFGVNGNVLPTERSGPRRDRERNRTNRAPRRSPIILVPGDGGSQLEAKLDKPSVVHYFCDRKTDDYFNLWLNLALLVPLVIDCWVDNMRLSYDNVTRTTRNSPGVTTRTPGLGNTTSVEYVDPSQVSATGYYNLLVAYMVARGYTRGVDIRGAPYDFRKSPTELADYYTQFKALVEDTHRLNANEPSLIVCHSMGCPVMLYFFNRQPLEWKQTYVRSFITLAAPWGGAVKALKAFTSGDNLGVIVVPALTIRQDERTFPSLAYLMPTAEFWSPDEVLMSVGPRNYTVANYEQLFENINNTDGYNMWLDTKDLTSKLQPPDMDVHCLHGRDVHTMEVLAYQEGKFNKQPKITYGDGDGTVNTRSLRGCLRWTGQQSQDVHYANFTGADHMAIMGDPRVMEYIGNVAIRG